MLNNNKGIALITSYLIITFLLLTAVTFYWQSYNESNMSLRHRLSTEAFALAEAGVERAIYDLRRDFEVDPTNPGWADGDINGAAVGPDDSFYQLYPAPIALGNGTFDVWLSNADEDNDGTYDRDKIWVRSTGTVQSVTRTVRSYIRMENANVWNNVLFAGSGQGGAVINGNVDIRGSIHLLGNAVNPITMSLSGAGNMGNNYEGMPAELLALIPALPQTVFNGQTVDTLDAKLRVREGQVLLDGTGEIGQADNPANTVKETVDATFVADGFTGNQADANVFSDNGSRQRYDLGNRITFPELSDPYAGFPTYMDYLRANAHIISDQAQLDQIADIHPDSIFDFTGPGGSISMDGDGNMAISGIVFIENGGSGASNFQTFDAGGGAGWPPEKRRTINYTGTGSIVVTGNVNINTNFLPKGANSFPTNIAGFMTPNNITFSSQQRDSAGLFYAENSITCSDQTNVLGTFISDVFDMGSQVPSIYQVPETMNNLPPGLVGNVNVWYLSVVVWQED